MGCDAQSIQFGLQHVGRRREGGREREWAEKTRRATTCADVDGHHRTAPLEPAMGESKERVRSLDFWCGVAACLTVACAAWPLGSRWPLVGSSTQGQAVATISMTELTQATPSAPHACAWRGQLFNRQCPTVRSPPSAPQRERPPSPAPLQHLHTAAGVQGSTQARWVQGGGYRGSSLPPQGLPSPDDMEPFVHPAARVQQQWAGSPPAGNLQHPRNPV